MGSVLCPLTNQSPAGAFKLRTGSGFDQRTVWKWDRRLSGGLQCHGIQIKRLNECFFVFGLFFLAEWRGKAAGTMADSVARCEFVFSRHCVYGCVIVWLVQRLCWSACWSRCEPSSSLCCSCTELLSNVYIKYVITMSIPDMTWAAWLETSVS